VFDDYNRMNDTPFNALALGECNSELSLALFQLPIARFDARAWRTREVFLEFPTERTVLYGIISGQLMGYFTMDGSAATTSFVMLSARVVLPYDRWPS